jgi:CDP-4-dehydro-6-deoxyglucose reductase
VNKTVSNRVILANGKHFEVSQSSTILSSALGAGISLEYSCRTGRCGICRTRVVSGETRLVAPEAALTTEESGAGFILTCCRSASSDLELDLEDLGELASYKARTVPARIDLIEYVSHDVVRVILRTPPKNMLEFRAGQYVDVIGPTGFRRSYSIANAPREDGKIKLEIRKVKNGIFSQYWFNEAKVNDLLRIEGPLGTFSLRPKSAKNLVLLATGTGVAPLKAILEELSSSIEHGRFPYQQIYLYWGGRVESDLYWRPEFPNLPLTFIPVLSREPKWSGKTGHVQQAVLDDQIELSRSLVYACGSEAMIRSAREALVSAGLNPKEFYSDAFVSSS